MRRNKKRQQQNKNKFYPDVIAYYSHQKNQNYYAHLVSSASAEDIHAAAIEIFGKTYYISFEDIIK
jgi:hypothetical protein